MTSLIDLPKDLPAPEDDGACNHLTGLALPPIELPSTAGEVINLATIPGYVVVYCYPMTGRPDRELPDGWDQIPGARGCTPQSCSFRDHYKELKELQTTVHGLSTQPTNYQQEAVARLHLPFALLSDHSMHFSRAMGLPTFQLDGMNLIKRLTLIAKEGKIVKVFYPVFPPDENADQVIAWLRQQAA